MITNQVVSIAGLVAVVIIVFCLTGVMLAALKRANGNIVIHLIWRGVVKFMLKIARLNLFSLKGKRPGKDKKPSWHLRRGRALLAVLFLACMIVAPVYWWLQKPA